MSEAFPAARADIEWRANSGTVKQDIADVRRTFRESVSAISSDALRLQLASEKLNKAIARHGPESAAAKRAEVEFRQALQQTTVAAQREAGVLDEAALAKGRFGQAGVVATRGLNQMRSSAAGATAGFLGATGLVFALQSGIRSAVEFDRAMRNVNSIAHLSEQQLSALSQEVVALSNTTGKGPTDLANGLYDIVSSGFQANDALKILEASAKAASAGMTDTATSSKGVVAVLNAYHLQASEARRVSDLLFQEVNLGVNTFEELAQNMGDVVPQASALKIPLEQVLAALALITKNGTPAAEASTQVSRVLTAMIKPSKELRAEFHRMGYESGQAAVAQLGLAGVLDRLSRDAAGNQQTIAAWLGEVRGIRGVLNLTGDNLESYNALLAQMDEATLGVGATQRAFEEQQKSLGFQIDRTRANLQALASSQGGVSSALAGTAANVADLTGGLVELSVALGKVGSVDIPGPLGSLASTLETVNKWTNPVRMELELMKTAMDALKDSTDAATLSLGDLSHARAIVAPGEGNLGGSKTGPATGSKPALYVLPGQNKGLVKEGNIDLTRRPVVRNKDGSISTVKSVSFTNDDGSVLLLPEVIRDKHGRAFVGTPKQALAYYRSTGEFLGIFNSEAEANAYADRLHREQATYYSQKSTASSRNTDYQIALNSAPNDKKRLALLTQHRHYLDSRIATLQSKGDLAGWQKQQLLKLIQLRNQEQAQIDQILAAAVKDTSASTAKRERAQLDAEKRLEQSSPSLRAIRRAQSRAASTKGKQDDVDQAQREVTFWRNRLEQLDRTSGAYEHVAAKLSAAQDKLARAQGKLDAAQTAAAADPTLQAPRNLRLQQLRAQLTDSQDDDLRVARVIEAYWQRRLNQTKKTSKVYEDILQQLVSAHDAVKGLEQQLAGSGPGSAGALQAEFLSTLQSIIAKSAPNFGSYGGQGLSSTQAYELVESNRETAAHLSDLVGRRRDSTDGAYVSTAADF